MGGRRRDFSGQFAVSEIDFWLNDPRVIGSSAAFRTYIHYAWMIAVKERRDTLPTWWDTRAITRAAGLEHRTGQKCAREAEQKCLHIYNPDGTITVCGVRDKHPNLAWKKAPINADMQSHKRVETQTQTETESEVGLPAQNAAPTTGSKTQFPEVYSTLRAVDAKVYRDLAPTEAFETILTRESLRLGGPERIVAEAQRFAVWMEDQFASKRQKRDARHRPCKRFTDWLARENPHGGNGSRDERPTDRIAREAKARLADA